MVIMVIRLIATILLLLGLAAGQTGMHRKVFPSSCTPGLTVTGSGTIPFPMTAPGTGSPSWNNATNFRATNIVFSPTDTSAYVAISYTDSSFLTPVAWLIKWNRSTNTVVWFVNTLTVAYQVGQGVGVLNLSPDGNHLFIASVVTLSAINQLFLQKHRTSDGASEATNGITASQGNPIDSDIATISGTQYLAVGGLDVSTNPSNYQGDVTVAHTSDLSLVHCSSIVGSR
jgi:hypothetical protein